MRLQATPLIIAAILGLPLPLIAQDQKPGQDQKADAPPTQKRIVCSFCGAERDKGETCPFCGGKESQPSKKDADTPKVEPVPNPQERPQNQLEKGVKGTAPSRDAEPVPGVLDDEEEKKLRAYKDDNMAKGDYYFKTGYYLKASEAYRVAVLAEPVNPWKKLAFGHALFAIGNYSYSSYALRRAVSQLDPKTPFTPDISALFPSKKAFEKAVKDLKRYVTYSPRDAAGLSVLGYMLFTQGEDEHAKEMFVYLQRLAKPADSDAFASFFLKQIEARKDRPELTPPKEQKLPEPTPPPPAPAPQAPQPQVSTPEGTRQGEEPAKPKPEGAKAMADE